MTRRVAQNQPKFSNRGVHAIGEVDVRVLGPQPVSQFLTTHQFPSALQEQGKDLKGLDLKSDPSSVLKKLACPQIDGKMPEARDVRDGRGGHAIAW
jgi:hypothetical protein